MVDQTINMTMHTLNKYGVPCTDVTDYSSADTGSSGSTFYLQKNHYQYLVRTKIKGAALTGIPGYVYCFFRNNQDVWQNEDGDLGIGYCDYYSLHNGQLIKTVELPFMVGGDNTLRPMVDINSDFVVYSAVEFEGDVTKYNRFRRDAYGELTLEGRVLLEQRYYIPSIAVYLGGINGIGGGSAIPPRDIPSSDVDPDTDTITLINHGFAEDEWINLETYGMMPGGLASGTWYVVVNPTQHTFQLAHIPPNYNGGAVIDITDQGTGSMTVIVDFGYYAYDNAYLLNELRSIRPSCIRANRIYVNKLGEDMQTGRTYYEALPNLSVTNSMKRVALGYIDLFVGDFAVGTEYVIQTPFYNLLPSDYPNRSQYTMLVNIFNDSVDDLSGDYTIGSGQIQGYWYNNGQTFLILVSYDDIRGGSGNQAYQKWYDSFGTYAYTWTYPTYLHEGATEFYILYPRIDEGMAFYYLAVNGRTGAAYLFWYHLMTGQLLARTELINPTLAVDGLAYRLSNRQLIAGKYLMLHTTSSYHVFFDVGSPHLGIRGQITMEGPNDEYGFFVVPEIRV